MENNESNIFQKTIKILKFGGIGIASLVVFILLVDKIIMPLYVGYGDEVTLPDVTQSDYSSALIALDNLGFKVIKESKFDPYASTGIILSQKPLPFTVVKKGRTIHLTVSLGEQKVTVPNLVGISARDAEIKLQENNLKVGEIEYQFSSMPEGIVINQQFESMTQMKRGTEVSFTISSGEEKKQVIMPNTINKSVSIAADMVKREGLFVGRTLSEVRNDLLPNTVIFSHPSEGQILIPGDTVYFIISKIDTSSTRKH
ncbi:MAG: PASTA domain-containing protein [bacterium]|nr:PASTA domain-containing protein [bacterium]